MHAELPPAQHYYLAFSGGLDSMVCLDLMSKLSLPVTLLHVNHQLQAESYQWAEQVVMTAEQYHLPLILHTETTQPDTGESIEAWARGIRYDFFLKQLKPHDCLVTAHHADDQAETFLLQALRGAGPEGLAGMRAVKNFGPGLLARPLLNYTRAQILNYAESVALTWIDDPSNSELKFDRNYLRHEILSRWPGAVKTLSRASQHCQTMVDYLNSTEPKREGRTLLIETLKDQPEIKLRQWLKSAGVPMPSTAICQEMLTSVAFAREDANPIVTWSGWSIRRYRQMLYLVPESLEKLDIDLPEGLLLKITKHNKPQLVRYACTTDKLKKHWQALGVPPWLRDKIPLVFLGDEDEEE